MKDKAGLIIRPATPMDSVNVLRLLKDGWKEGAAAHLGTFEESRVLAYVGKTIERAFCVVAERSGRILGSYALAPAQLPATNAPVMVEAWLAVRPEQRERGVTQRLLEAGERFLDQQRMPALLGTNMMASAGYDRVISARPGYAPVRCTFLREPAAKAAAA